MVETKSRRRTKEMRLSNVAKVVLEKLQKELNKLDEQEMGKKSRKWYDGVVGRVCECLVMSGADCIRSMGWDSYQGVVTILVGFTTRVPGVDVVVEYRSGFVIDLDSPLDMQVKRVLLKISRVRRLFKENGEWLEKKERSRK